MWCRELFQWTRSNTSSISSSKASAQWKSMRSRTLYLLASFFAWSSRVSLISNKSNRWTMFWLSRIISLAPTPQPIEIARENPPSGIRACISLLNPAKPPSIDSPQTRRFMCRRIAGCIHHRVLGRSPRFDQCSATAFNLLSISSVNQSRAANTSRLSVPPRGTPNGQPPRRYDRVMTGDVQALRPLIIAG